MVAFDFSTRCGINVKNNSNFAIYHTDTVLLSYIEVERYLKQTNNEKF